MRRTTALLGAGLVVLGSLLTAGPASARTAADAPVTVSRDVARTFYAADGTKKVVDQRTVHLTVDTTTNLKSLQQVHVSWSGAHVTGGRASDQNSDLAANEEYAFALFECRGVDSDTVPVDQRVSPETCWTQYADERFTDSSDPYPGWRSDAAATPAERAAAVNMPSGTLPNACVSQLFGIESQRWVPFVAPTQTYPGGPDGCDGQPPEAAPDNFSNLSLPSNETYGVTGTDGTGSASFDVFTGEDHASLGCSQTVPCSLVAIPVEGLSCDPAGTLDAADPHPTGDDLDAATSACEGTGSFKPGQLLNNGVGGDPAVDAQWWWAPSNWANRLSVPLSFAPPDDACDNIVGDQRSEALYGSELFAQTATQWAPAFCQNTQLFSIKHVQTPEPTSRRLLATTENDPATAGADAVRAALTTDPPDTPYPTPTTQAPVALTGFGIAFDVDGKNGQPVANLKLDARLLAKLMTESYPAQNFVKDAYPETPKTDTTPAYPTLSQNPLNLGSDPEFQALNPGLPAPASDAAATVLLLNSQTDVIRALTSYVNADPEARAWLDGAPDPWGMRVNPNYLGIALPVAQWPTLDTFEPTDEYQPGKNDCLYANPAPYLPLVASPTSTLFNIGQDMEYAIAQSQTTCQLGPNPGDLTGSKVVANGRQTPGFRFMLGLVSLGDARREGLSLAQLETQTTGSVPTGTFTDDTGRIFEGPTDDGLRNAVAGLTQTADKSTWTMDYTALRTDPRDATAYPGTMLVSADVPTTGLDTVQANDYSVFLSYAAGDGQTPGTSQGQLPPGFLPMTEANGMAPFVAYTKQAAADVKAQDGGVPPTAATAANPEIDTSTLAGDGSSGDTGSQLPDVSAPEVSTPDLPQDATVAAPQVAPAAATAATAQDTSKVGTGPLDELMPMLFALAIVAGVGTVLVRRSRLPLRPASPPGTP